MENDHNQQPNPAFHQIQMRMSGQHQYPHSHHGTPATEYTGFVWPSPHDTGDPAAFDRSPPLRPNHQSLHPLVMPQWPSMLSSQSPPTGSSYYPSVVPQAQLGTVSTTPLMTPLSASSARSGSTPRRTLTDEERRKMCEYHEKNPSAKQNQIGEMFGVERRLDCTILHAMRAFDPYTDLKSTVSKVLRQKEKYLQKQTEVVRSPERRAKGKSPDIERTLSNWVIKEQRKGTVLSDEVIRDKAQYFSSVSGPDHLAPNPANNASWLKNFKRRHNISGRMSSKDSSASDDVSNVSRGVQKRYSPRDMSPMSPVGDTSPSPGKLSSMRSEESFKIESPDAFSDLTTTLSANSLSAGFVESSTSSYSPNPLLSPASPFFGSDSTGLPLEPLYRRSDLAAVSPPAGSNFQRPRSQTFPMIYQDLQPQEGTEDGSRFMSGDGLDATMDELNRPLDSIDEAMDDSSSTGMDMEMGQPQTIIPAQMMHPPPLPASAMAARAESHNGASTPVSDMPMTAGFVGEPSQHRSMQPSQDEARRALRVVWQYFANQPRGVEAVLDMEETAMMGRIMERLRERNRDRGSS